MTYEWDPEEPVDSTFQASNIHTQMQEDKVSLRERFEMPNADFNEHGDADSASAGLHVSSKVGWARASTLENRFTPGGFGSGSLHWVTDESLMYVINKDGEYDALSTIDHVELEGLDDDDHTQYIIKDGSRDMSGNITLDGGTIQPQDYPTGDSNALDAAHADESWYDAHGADSIQSRHIADGAVDGYNLALENNNSDYYIELQRYQSFPIVGNDYVGEAALLIWGDNGEFASGGSQDAFIRSRGFIS